MKKQNQAGSPNAAKKVHAVRSTLERRVERQIEQALSRPESVDDWDDLDFTILEHRNHKAALE